MARTRPVGAFLTVAVVALVSVGAAGYAVGRARTPDVLAAAPPPSSFPVVLEPFHDERQVTVVPTVGAAVAITARRGGTVTGSACRVGETVDSGTAPWSVDGSPVLALATSEPMHRDLAEGARGSDVLALQAELARLGYDVAADGRYDARTGRAVAALRQATGMAAGTGLARADVVWLPEAHPTLASCAPLGSDLAAGDALAEPRPALLAARVQPVPANLVPGARTLTVGGLAVAVDGEGLVAEGDLPAIAALPETLVVLQALGEASPVQLTGTFALAVALTTATVPASAVIVDGAATCVSSGGATTTVEVVASQLGQSVISFGGGAPPAVVDTLPGPSSACG